MNTVTNPYDYWAHYTLTYKDFVIKIKQDFGSDGKGAHLIDGMPCAWGYVATDAAGFVNVMPGATWFQTVAQAKSAIDILIDLGGKPVSPYDREVDSKVFWERMKAR